MIKWKEKRHHYNNEKPDSYELKTDSLKISVHRHFFHEPDAWLVSCHDVGIVQKELQSKDDELAKQEALNLVGIKLKKMLKSIGRDK